MKLGACMKTKRKGEELRKCGGYEEIYVLLHYYINIYFMIYECMWTNKYNNVGNYKVEKFCQVGKICLL